MVIRMAKFCDKVELRLGGLVCGSLRIEWWCGHGGW